MELWIRSQDKLKLVKVNYVYVMESDDHFTIYGETIDSSPIIATYKSEERALEVLDEIQNILKLKNMYEYDRELVLKGWQNYKKEQVETVREQMSVYEMPEK